ncbi:MAG: cysteine synthase family protein [Thaumarchaeota archaeon]|nr:cysteine synthase family protein [Nitrososphaerota archaeon]
MERSGTSEDILGAVGNTPLVRLARVGSGVKPVVYGKLEFMNPGGSVKDRIASYLIRDAEAKGLLKKGGTIIEPTSGNTGLGLAMVAAVRGYRTIFTMPDKVSEEKKACLRAFGAEVILAPTEATPDSPQHYVNVARRLSKEVAGSYMPNQYVNPGNPEAHYRTTGPEIWTQTGGRIDAFIACVGTGGTISGVGKFLKEMSEDVSVVGIEPEGSIYHNTKHGTDYPLHSYLVEGIGEDFIPATYDQSVVDEIIQVSDEETFSMARRLTREEGIFAGGSSGTAVAGALKFAEKNSTMSTIVAILPDTGRSYVSKFYNDDWLRSKGL